LAQCPTSIAWPDLVPIERHVPVTPPLSGTVEGWHADRRILAVSATEEVRSVRSVS
jgi:hypothetical protein